MVPGGWTPLQSIIRCKVIVPSTATAYGGKRNKAIKQGHVTLSHVSQVKKVSRVT